MPVLIHLHFFIKDRNMKNTYIRTWYTDMYLRVTDNYSRSNSTTHTKTNASLSLRHQDYARGNTWEIEYKVITSFEAL